METYLSQQGNSVNSYLQERNKKFYRGHSAIAHPLYQKELNNAINSINNFLDMSILKFAYYKRLQAIYGLSAEKCFNNKSNNYSFSESQVCEEVMLERDVVLSNIKNYQKEVEVRLVDSYEKQVKYAFKGKFEPEAYENAHRSFLLRVNFLYRYYYYFTAQKMFVDSWK